MMGMENKHGRYEKFDWQAARWVCPECKHDKLALFPINEKKMSFICGHCLFDSSDYLIYLGPKSTFNSVHRWMMREWKWIKALTIKFHDKGLYDTFGVIDE
jgi:hypothetical protein